MQDVTLCQSVSDRCQCHSIMALINTRQIILWLQFTLLTISLSYAQNERILKLRPKLEEKVEPSRHAKRNADDDQQSSETHHHHGHGRDHSKGAKFFMYAHQPDKKSYEFGYKRGNDHHVIERYEKAGPKHNFKTKVRWHDAHGGHGEQYWDYNHAPKHHEHHDHHHHHGVYDDHGHGHGHGSYHGHGYGHSEPVPSIVEAESAISLKAAADDYNQSKLYKRFGYEKKPTDILKKSPSKKNVNLSLPVQQNNSENDYEEVPSAFPAVLGFDPYVPPKMAESRTRTASPTKKEANIVATTSAPLKNFGRRSQRPYKTSKQRDVPKLAYDLDTGRVFDEKSGKWFKLVQV